MRAAKPSNNTSYIVSSRCRDDHDKTCSGGRTSEVNKETDQTQKIHTAYDPPDQGHASQSWIEQESWDSSPKLHAAREPACTVQGKFERP